MERRSVPCVKKVMQEELWLTLYNEECGHIESYTGTERVLRPVSESRLSPNSECANPEMTTRFLFQRGSSRSTDLCSVYITLFISYDRTQTLCSWASGRNSCVILDDKQKL